MNKYIVFIFFMLILFSACNNEKTLINNGAENDYNIPIESNEAKEIILDEMMKNHSNDINNLTDKEELIKQKELEDAHERFIELTNESNNTSDNLYKPNIGDSWQWQLSGDIDTSFNVNMYDVDLVETPQSVIDELHSYGIKVICYFSAGSWEESRDDESDFPEEILGRVLDGWQDEKWLDISNYEKFAFIMMKRLDLAKIKKCDGVEPDNVDAYSNNNGFGLTYEDQLKYNKWLSVEAHKRGLSIGLKNDLDQIKDLIDYFDFAINEQCFQYDECELLLPFIENGKAVFGVEYELSTNQFCNKANEMDFSWLKTNYDLDGKVISCD